MLRDFLERRIPQLLLAPSVLLGLVFVYGFILWSGFISLTDSKLLPKYELKGLHQYSRLFQIERFIVSYKNLFCYGLFFILISLILGLLLAILLDQRIRIEGFLKLTYLYPMALSFIVTGTIWKWLLNPAWGLENMLHRIGLKGLHFDWSINPKMSIYTLVIAAVWQSSGFMMALFLAALRGIDPNIFKAASMDGASRFRTYISIVIPMLRPVTLTCVVLLIQTSIKSFDIVMSLTGGGPGISSDLPATFMYDYTFTRNQLALGSASAMIMLFTTMAITVPYLYSELRKSSHDR